MAIAQRLRRIRLLTDAAFFIAVVLVAFWALGDRQPAWLTPFYVATALVAAILLRRLIVRHRAKRDRLAHPEGPSAK